MVNNKEHIEQIKLIWQEYEEVPRLIKEFYEACKKREDLDFFPSVEEYVDRCSSGNVVRQVRPVIKTIHSFFQNSEPESASRKMYAPALVETVSVFWPWKQYLIWSIKKNVDVDKELFLKYAPDRIREPYRAFMDCWGEP